MTLKKTLILCCLAAPILASCMKQHTCQCTNPGGTFDAFSMNGSENEAYDECNDYYEINFGDVPFNETYCEIK